jgi:hypothetical protein
MDIPALSETAPMPNMSVKYSETALFPLESGAWKRLFLGGTSLATT